MNETIETGSFLPISRNWWMFEAISGTCWPRWQWSSI